MAPKVGVLNTTTLSLGVEVDGFNGMLPLVLVSAPKQNSYGLLLLLKFITFEIIEVEFLLMGNRAAQSIRKYKWNHNNDYSNFQIARDVSDSPLKKILCVQNPSPRNQVAHQRKSFTILKLSKSQALASYF